MNNMTVGVYCTASDAPILTFCPSNAIFIGPLGNIIKLKWFCATVYEHAWSDGYAWNMLISFMALKKAIRVDIDYKYYGHSVYSRLDPLAYVGCFVKPYKLPIITTCLRQLVERGTLAACNYVFYAVGQREN